MRGQSMSFDAIAATFLFVLIAVFGALYAYNFFTGDVGVVLTREANTLGEVLIRDLSTAPDGSGQVRIDERKLLDMIERSQAGYDSLRSELGMRSDFCVFFEDEGGNLVTFAVRDDDGDPQIYRASFGSSLLSLNASGTPIGCDTQP